eukprot:8305993-Pyramimonas_sp.AAC.1
MVVYMLWSCVFEGNPCVRLSEEPDGSSTTACWQAHPPSVPPARRRSKFMRSGRHRISAEHQTMRI